jgi:hypothetical protein
VKVDTSAQQSMRVLQSEHVAPVMRELGLRGSVNSFRLPSSTHFATIGFKRSRSSNAAVVFFSVVAQVISREEWRREADRYGLGARPDGHATYGIGSQWVLGPGEWAAYGGLPVEPLAATVIAAVRDAVAALRRFAGEA